MTLAPAAVASGTVTVPAGTYNLLGDSLVNTLTQPLTAPSFIATSSTPPANGMFLPATNTVGLSSNSTSVLSVNSNGYVGLPAINTAYAMRMGQNLTGATSMAVINLRNTIQSDVTVQVDGYLAQLQTAASAFTITTINQFHAGAVTKGSGSTITNLYGYIVDSSMTQGTYNYGFVGSLASAANTYNLYMAGTAPNYFAGQTTVGSTSLTLGSGSVAQQFGVVSAAATNVGAVIRGASSQTADFQQWQNSAGTVLAKVDSSGNLTAASIIPTGSTVPANGFYLPSANTVGIATNGTSAIQIGPTGKIGIGVGVPSATSLNLGANITGATSANAYRSGGPVLSDVTSQANYFITSANTQATSFTLGTLDHFYAVQGTFGAGSTVTTQVGFNVDASLIGATNNYGFYGNIPSGANRWNLYMAGTAYNFLAGITSIGSNSQTLGSGSVAQQFGVVSSSATTVGAVIRGAASQTANLQEWQNSAGTVLVAVGANGTIATGTTAGAPTIASAATIAPVTPIAFVSGVTTINTITPPAPISTNGGQITLIPTGIFTTGVSGNIAIASTAVVSKALILTYDPITTKWYPSY